MAKAKKPMPKKPVMKGKGAKAPLPSMKAAGNKSGKKKNPFGHEGE